MDATALALCRDQNMLLKVFSIFEARRAEARRDGRRTRARSSTAERKPESRHADRRVKKTAEQKMAKSVETLKHDFGRCAPAARIPACSTTCMSTTTAR